ncbi:MSHA biogenesis protein MshP [Vibrio chagasii]|nr:MSHA biogenesis protein MshP [Vibrio chagasii]CAH7018250.1 MSHA biogenesis protein MshP [Vibrio chagasii]CAH7289451.1 MSHA biogenesis protein MshP [Vibrio chagasii]CAH7345377.1 MSHA biogenesis protein MshP [Vibrio chagasii]CAH7446587.1 MSHA biogenesis protein MshP [Vibrio chagasii]
MFRKSLQKGSALIMVIFVIVVLGFLATSLSRTSWSDNDSNTRVVLGTQAWLLSHSVNEYVMTQFYPNPDPAASSAVASVCSSNDLQPGGEIFAVASSMVNTTPVNCSLDRIQCSNRGELDGFVFYVLESSVICGSGVSQVQRNQELWVKEAE